MKSPLKLLLVCAAVCSFVAIDGCSTLDKALLTPQYQPFTNSAGGVSSNLTGYVLSPGVSNTLAIGGQVSSFLPPPYGTIASGVLALAAAGLGLYAKTRSNAAVTASTALNAVIAGVESAGNELIKQSIQSHAAGAGVQTFLDTQVKAVTGVMAKTTTPATPKTS